MTDKTPPGPPDTVTVGPYRIAVTVDEVAHNRAQVAEASSLFGRYNPSAQEITVAPDLHRDTEADTILHEVLHVIVLGAGLHADGAPLADEDAHEQVVAATATALLDVLRRNPALVAYLTA